jgi:hypothetical protein
VSIVVGIVTIACWLSTRRRSAYRWLCAMCSTRSACCLSVFPFFIIRFDCVLSFLVFFFFFSFFEICSLCVVRSEGFETLLFVNGRFAIRVEWMPSTISVSNFKQRQQLSNTLLLTVVVVVIARRHVGDVEVDRSCWHDVSRSFFTSASLSVSSLVSSFPNDRVESIIIAQLRRRGCKRHRRSALGYLDARPISC